MSAKANGLKFEEEHVTYVRDESHVERLIPKISVGSGVSKRRNFEPEDMARVLDYDGIKEATPKDCQLLYCENGEDGPQFVSYHICIRGGYIFYFDPDDVDDKTGSYTTYESTPIGVVPLDDTIVQFPPGGRRAFREHAMTDARNGYELAILHNPNQISDDDRVEVRPPFFLVAESMGQRKEWEKAIKVRGGLRKPTLLRMGYTSASVAKTTSLGAGNDGAKDGGASSSQQPESAKMSKSADSTRSAEAAGPRNDEMLKIAKQEKSNKAVKGFATTGRRKGESKSTEMQIMEVAEDAELASAVVEFGAADFNEKEWVDRWFQSHSDFEASDKCNLMDQWQNDMKRSLKGAVLEQYEYFVQASGQMTEMGREVSSLKSRIETQVDTLKEMKEIDFLGILYEGQEEDVFQNEQIFGGLGDDDDSEVDLELEIQKSRGAQSLFGNTSIDPGKMGEKLTKDDDETEENAPKIEVPAWLKNVDEEVSELVRECRYNDAIELHVKSKNEVEDLLERHDDPSPYRIPKKQLDDVRSLRRSLKTLGDRISRRMVESLRRKNEALRQASKRERSDPNSAMAPIVSPTALNDDGLYLRLLVKLGRTSEATEAYSHRRSLLLLETLQERPIAGAGTVDLVIYAAQLSQSFFSCLANSVESFLDLFVAASTKDDKSEEESVASSLHSQSFGGGAKQLPAGAMASLVLWCDAELSKFASAFGGTRVLANLQLSPPGRDGPKGPRVVGGSNIEDGSKERRNAIEVAAQCIDQAFLHASENLDSVGLPLTPRLSVMIRARLKGCEKEVSELLDDRWQSLTKDWRIEDVSNDSRTPLRTI